jgi:hypothetical protein
LECNDTQRAHVHLYIHRNLMFHKSSLSSACMHRQHRTVHFSWAQQRGRWVNLAAGTRWLLYVSDALLLCPSIPGLTASATLASGLLPFPMRPLRWSEASKLEKLFRKLPRSILSIFGRGHIGYVAAHIIMARSSNDGHRSTEASYYVPARDLDWDYHGSHARGSTSVPVLSSGAAAAHSLLPATL